MNEHKPEENLPAFSLKDELPGGLVDRYSCCGQGCCDDESNVLEKVTVETALEALDNLDDYARMSTGVIATGPIRVLARYILQNNSEPLDARTLKVYENLIKT